MTLASHPSRPLISLNLTFSPYKVFYTGFTRLLKRYILKTCVLPRLALGSNMGLENSSENTETLQPFRAPASSQVTYETLYKLLTDPPGESLQSSGDQWVNASDPTSTSPVVTGGALPPNQYSWNLIVGIIASVVFLLVTAAVLFGLTAFKNYMKKRNRTLSADTGVFSPRRGSKAGLDMIDNTVVMTAHSSLQRSGSLRKQIQKFLSR